MVYAIGALAACLCLAIGVTIGYLIWGRPVMMSLEERIELQNQQLQLEGQLHLNPDPAKQAELNTVNRKLTEAARRTEAQWKRAARAKRRRLLRDLVANPD